MESKISGRLGGERSYFDVEDGHTITPMKEWPKTGRGQSGAPHSGTTMQEDAQFTSNESGFENAGAIGEMPFKEVGDMAMHEYGADLSPRATNSLGTFDGTSDTMDPALAPRPGGANFRL